MSSREPLVGTAALVSRAFANEDLTPLSDRMLDRIEQDPQDADALMDLNVILQLMLKPRLALEMQRRAIASRRVFHLDAPSGARNLRLLVFMIPGDLMANAPVDFLLAGSSISLDMLYISADMPFPDAIPDHDIAFVAIAHSDESIPVLEELRTRLADWPRPVLNLPDGILKTTREGAYRVLNGVPGIRIPAAVRTARGDVVRLADGGASGNGVGFPLIARPVNSHAGHGLAKIENSEMLRDYLRVQAESEFYLSPYIDYRSEGNRFRKYRIVLIEGRAYASHMAISDNWMVHYLNAGMTESAEKRKEEERFMESFDSDFGARHARAFESICARVGLDYLVIDCAETTNGELLVFEIDAGAVVHAMDSAQMFPYKHVQMRKVFGAFQRMLYAARDRETS